MAFALGFGRLRLFAHLWIPAFAGMTAGYARWDLSLAIRAWFRAAGLVRSPGVFVRIRIHRIGGIFRISLRPDSAFRSKTHAGRILKIL